MKKFKDHLNPRIIEETQKEYFISIEEEVKSNLASKIKKITLAAVVGGVALGTLPHLGKSKENKQPQLKLVNPIQQQKQDDEQKTTLSKEQIYHQNFHKHLQNEFKQEYPIIMKAAQRNGIDPYHHERLAMLFAIRRAENGGHGKQFGVLDPKAAALPNETFDQSLDRQAGHASVGVINGEKRYQEYVAKGGKLGFVEHFRNRWAPPNVANDPTDLNKNWVKNVSTHRNNFLNPPTE